MTSSFYNPGDPVLKTNPWPTYARLRDEAPVYLVQPGTAEAEDFYVLSRFDDVAMALRDKRFSSYIRRGDYLDLPIMMNREAPGHTKLRRITNRAFGPRALAPVGAIINRIVDELVSDLLSRPEVEFVEHFTTELPMRVVGEMVGIPVDRKADIQRGTEAAIELAMVIGGTDPDLVPGFYDDYMGLVNFIDGLAAERVGCPHRGDILSDLVNREAAGELTHDEMVGLGWNYITGGSVTTMNLLCGGMHLLLTDRALADRLIADPERTGDFIEEYLRIEGPVQTLLRRLETDVELHGVLMPEGSLVHLLLPSANRDPRKFPNPDVFDLDRANAGDHLAWAAGPHFCPGTPLARMIAETAFRALYPHLSRFSLDPARPPRLRARPGAYGLEYMGLLVSHDEPAQALT